MPRQQITAATVGQKWTKMRLKTLTVARVGDRHYCLEVEKDENGKWFIRCHMCHRIVWGNTIEETVNAWNGGGAK